MGSIRERLLDMGEEVRCIPVPVDTSPEQCSSGGGCSDEACDAYHDDDDDDEESPGDSFLFAAVDNNVTAIRQLIQEMGVSPSHSNPAKQSALHLAALWGNVEAVQELVKHKALVNTQNTLTGATPLHAIVMNRYAELPRLVECVDILLAHGADPTIEDLHGKTPADYCHSGNNEEMALLARFQPKPTLFQAIDKRDLSAIEQVIESPDYKNRMSEECFAGKAPFQYVLDLILQDTMEPKEQEALTDLMEISKLILRELEDNSDGSFLAEVCTGGNSARPPLFRVGAVLQDAYDSRQSEEHDKYTTLKIKALENLFRLLAPFWPSKDENLVKLFHAACRKNDSDMVFLYVEVCKVDPNAKGAMGMTALHFAARSGSTKIVRYLLSRKGIDPHIVDVRGKTPLDAAMVNQKEDVVALLGDF